MVKGKAFRIDYDDHFGNTLDWKSPAGGRQELSRRL